MLVIYCVIELQIKIVRANASGRGFSIATVEVSGEVGVDRH